jgi:hypothetical protein
MKSDRIPVRAYRRETLSHAGHVSFRRERAANLSLFKLPGVFLPIGWPCELIELPSKCRKLSASDSSRIDG